MMEKLSFVTARLMFLRRKKYRPAKGEVYFCLETDAGPILHRAILRDGYLTSERDPNGIWLPGNFEYKVVFNLRHCAMPDLIIHIPDGHTWVNPYRLGETHLHT